jgi:hypothetical protein
LLLTSIVILPTNDEAGMVQTSDLLLSHLAGYSVSLLPKQESVLLLAKLLPYTVTTCSDDAAPADGSKRSTLAAAWYVNTRSSDE